MYSVHQHWDPLKVCIVGRSYSPEFYSFIKNSRVRTVMERIAEETEEDYQKLIKLLESFGVKILRPIVTDDYKDYLGDNNRIASPPMTPRDYSAMIGNTFYFGGGFGQAASLQWDKVRGESWPEQCPNNKEEYDALPDFIKQELAAFGLVVNIDTFKWKNILDHISETNEIKHGLDINSAMTTRVGRDLYFGTTLGTQITDVSASQVRFEQLFPKHRCHVIDTQGHSDGTFCPVKPGLIVSLYDVPTYRDTFPDWEVVYLPGQSWGAIPEFLNLKNKNKGKWWVPGEELNDDFTDFVEGWLDHWVGYVEETVFDVNMLVIDEKNVVCNNYNKQVFDAFERHGVTPHVINFRHRYFWDGGLHCVTSDVHREGAQQDYFPQRG
jgi:hypothetical protein